MLKRKVFERVDERLCRERQLSRRPFKPLSGGSGLAMTEILVAREMVAREAARVDGTDVACAMGEHLRA